MKEIAPSDHHIIGFLCPSLSWSKRAGFGSVWRCISLYRFDTSISIFSVHLQFHAIGSICDSSIAFPFFPARLSVRFGLQHQQRQQLPLPGGPNMLGRTPLDGVL